MIVPDTVRSTDGVTIRLHHLGGSGPPLLLCHATGFCGPVWEPIARILSRRFRCIALDFRAHGRSTGPVGRPLVWQGMADDVLSVVDAISPHRPIAAVGHSMGGTSLVLAENTRPGTLSRAWAFEPILFERTALGDDAQPSEISIAARRRRATFASRAEAYRRYSAKPPLSLLDERALRAYVEHGLEELPDGTVTLCCTPEDEASVFEHHNTGARTTIADVTIPFALAASGDGRPPAVAAREAASEFGHLELFTYDHLSHFGPLEDPDGIAADILAWLAG